MQENKNLNINITDLEANNTEHKLIIGENYDALKNLLVTHYEKIDAIYIDPPYNTKSKKFIYQDNFTRKAWLSMMNERLELARKLLKDTGVIFISIDDTEQAYLKVLCDDIFGEGNFVACIVWLKGNAQNSADTIQRNHEYILCYAKNINTNPIYKIQSKQEVKIFKENDKFYYEGAGLSMGGGDGGGCLEARPNLGYTFYYNPHTKDIKPIIDYDKNEVRNILGNEIYKDDKNLIKQGYIPIRPPKIGVGNGFWKWSLEKTLLEIYRILIKETKNGFSVLRKEFIDSKFVKQKENGEFYAILDKLSPPKSFIDFIGGGKGTSELKDIFNNRVFNYPKPTNLIKHLLKISTNKDSIILDFFAGSGTTAQAVMELNAEDGGKRECILVTNNENNIAINVTRERLYRVINGKGSKGEAIKWQYSKDKKCLNDNSVRVFELEA